MAISASSLTGFMDGFAQGTQLSRQRKADQAAQEDREFQRQRQSAADARAERGLGLQEEGLDLRREEMEATRTRQDAADKRANEALGLQKKEDARKEAEFSIKQDLQDRKNRLIEYRETSRRLAGAFDRAGPENVVQMATTADAFLNGYDVEGGPAAVADMVGLFEGHKIEAPVGKYRISAEDAKARYPGKGVQADALLVGLRPAEVVQKDGKGVILLEATYENPDGSTVQVVTPKTKDSTAGSADGVVSFDMDWLKEWVGNNTTSVETLAQMSPEERMEYIALGEQTLAEDYQIASSKTGQTADEAAATKKASQTERTTKPTTLSKSNAEAWIETQRDALANMGRKWYAWDKDSGAFMPLDDSPASVKRAELANQAYLSRKNVGVNAIGQPVTIADLNAGLARNTGKGSAVEEEEEEEAVDEAEAVRDTGLAELQKEVATGQGLGGNGTKSTPADVELQQIQKEIAAREAANWPEKDIEKLRARERYLTRDWGMVK